MKVGKGVHRYLNDPNFPLCSNIQAEEQNSSGLAHQGDTTATVTLHIQIDDVDDNVPEFNAQSFTGSIWELAQLGDFIALADPGFISVEDKDLVVRR